MAHIEIGNSIRQWTTFRIVDPTDAEIAVLASEDDEKIITLMRKLREEDRLEYVVDIRDSQHDPLHDGSDPSPVNFRTDNS